MATNERVAQVAAAAAGAALAYYGFKKGGVTGTIVGVMGAGIATTTIATAAGAQVGPASQREVRQVVEVMASPEEAYKMWSRFEDFPRFMANVVEVRKTGANTWRWVAEGPLDDQIEWDSELTADRPGKIIAWRSTTPGVPNSGEVLFEPTEHGTRVLVVMRYGQAAGPIGALVDRVTGSGPESVVRQYLRRFKQLIEAGPVAQQTAL
ncbi:MAG TPA: SRPBCC family protein [Blastocatellia bacterium]|nr:SRPBCC family protein [Blastocatellia bacterium]